MAPPTAKSLGLTCGLLLALPACADALGEGDAHAPGTPMGTFHVIATQTANTCGEGALGAQPSWAFDVKLARDPSALYWNNGAELIRGELAADAVTFRFDTGIVMNMRAGAEHPAPPCSIRRHDQAAGSLDAPGEGVHAFTGSLAYDFAPTEGSRCEDLVAGAMPIVAALPCRFAYKLAATKSAP